MLDRKLVLSMVSMVWVYGGWMAPIKTTVTNNSSQMVNLFAQASGPVVDRYSKEPGWCYDKWPVLNLQPNEEMVLDLWIFREEQSKLKVSVLFSDDEDITSGDEAILSYLRSGSNMYIGDATFYSLGSSGVKYVHSGNIDCDLTESAGQYLAKITIY